MIWYIPEGKTFPKCFMKFCTCTQQNKAVMSISYYYYGFYYVCIMYIIYYTMYTLQTFYNSKSFYVYDYILLCL